MIHEIYAHYIEQFWIMWLNFSTSIIQQKYDEFYMKKNQLNAGL